MNAFYQKPEAELLLLSTADIITSSIDSAEDGFDGDIVDLSPVG